MARARDLEKDFLLALEKDLPVVHTPRRVHDPVGLNQPLAGETFVGLARAADFVVRYTSRLRICLDRHPFSIVNPDRRLRNSIKQWQNPGCRDVASYVSTTPIRRTWRRLRARN